MAADDTSAPEAGRDFIRDIVQADLQAGRHKTVVTRFPPEPNGYLHIGHAKSICLNFGIAEEFGGRCHLRMDDTNPTKEEQVRRAIKTDVRWLGFDWGRRTVYHASDYFEQLYDWAEALITAGKAYVDDQSPEEMRVARGTLTEPGRNSPFRDRSVAENLDLFRRMRAGEFPNGARVLRAKIDMASGNINLRDPVLYRILHAEHPRTGKAWCIYPSYDYAHGQSDAIEGITHSICTLEFEDHRPLYDWFLDNLPVPARPRQYEFARLNVTYTVLSKRVLTELVRGGHVDGLGRSAHADDRGSAPPRRAAGRHPRFRQAHRRRQGEQRGRRRHARILHSRGPEQDRLAAHGGAAAAEGRDRELSGRARSRSSRPSTIPTTRAGTRTVPFARELYIERDDFMENPPKKFFRLSPGNGSAAALRLFRHLPRRW